MADLYATRTDLFTYLPPDAIIAELGVFEGDFSEQLLTCHPRELHLFDLWQGAIDCGDKDGLNMKHVDDMATVFAKLKRRYAKYPLVTLHRGDIAQTLREFTDDYFDLVYVDADHDYQTVKTHLEISASKVKPGGLLGGHDYGAPYLGVVKAVNEFAAIRNFEWVAVTTDDGCPSFLLRRP